MMEYFYFQLLLSSLATRFKRKKTNLSNSDWANAASFPKR